MEFLLSPTATLAGLFAASFLAATLLPGGSEAVFAAVLLAHPEQAVAALALATLGNTLGGMTTYGMARWLPNKLGAAETARAMAWVRRHGAPILLLAWTPLIGDLLCGAAGWLRLAWLPCMAWMAVGKCARYAFIAWTLLPT
jgi:membrane protein YqaA with SNARE-associated domain